MSAPGHSSIACRLPALRVAVAALAAVLACAASARAQETGQALFQRDCANCHGEARVLRNLRNLPEAERNARLERFLPGHYAPDARARRLIIEYLASRVPR